MKPRPEVAVPAGAAEADHFPMTEGAWQRLADEERRLAATARRVGPDGGREEPPDSAAVAQWLLDTDSLDRRLVAIRTAVAAAEIVDRETTAVIGREVRVVDELGEDTFRLVIPGAGDPASGAISVASPMGGALLGAGPGDEVDFRTPAGVRTVKVIAVGGDAPPF
jgi:transcription elongation GreA/GreB family factor